MRMGVLLILQPLHAMPVSARSRGSGNAELLALDTVRGGLGNDGCDQLLLGWLGSAPWLVLARFLVLGLAGRWLLRFLIHHIGSALSTVRNGSRLSVVKFCMLYGEEAFLCAAHRSTQMKNPADLFGVHLL